MKKLLSILFAFAIIFSLATPVLAQPDDAAKGQVMEKLAKKKKHHKKKPKHILAAEGKGSVEGVKTTSIRSNRPQA
ncbi:MAG: hypothetical protein ABSA59_20565 [Terriglobia bacterium]|jgi:hypothetical protein